MDTIASAAVLRVDPVTFNDLSPVMRLLLARSQIEDLKAMTSDLEAVEKELASVVLEALTDGERENFKTKNFQVETISCPFCGDFGRPSNVVVPAATVYKQHTVYASTGALTPDSIRVLEDNGLEDLIKPTVNSQTLSAWFRKQIQSDPLYELAGQLAGIIKISDTFDVRIRKA